MSQLERLAEAIAAVGKQSGPVRQSIANGQRSAAQVAASVPNDENGYARRLRIQLYEASAALRDAERLLADFDKEADDFAARLVRGTSEASADRGMRTNAAGGTGQGADWLTPFGMELVDVRELDFRDNPIVGTFARDGLNVSDYDWLVDTWASVVAPGLVAGMTRDDFAALDERTGATPTRRTVDVFDVFLGDSSSMHASQRSNGTLELNGGRHRVTRAIARGIYYLPVRVFRPGGRP